MGLVEFLTAQLAADEAAALAAAPKPLGTRWKWATIPELPSLESRHIARHDPARVLADVKAKRAIVALHVPVHAPWAPDQCAVCVEAHDQTGCDNETWPCPTLRAVAQPYRDQPRWQEVWE